MSQTLCWTRPQDSPPEQPVAVQRVRRTALQLACLVSANLPQEKQPDFLTIELAALLHDVLDKKYVLAELAADPYAFFAPFFEKVASESGLDLIKDGRARVIARIVDNVSWSTEKKRLAAGQIEDWHRQCVELHCVQDADRLDAIGAFGEQRFLFVGTGLECLMNDRNHAVRGVHRCYQSVSVVLQSNIPASSHDALLYSSLHTPKNDPAYVTSATAHFYDKLLHIRERLKTEPGKKLAEKRHQFVSLRKWFWHSA